MIAYKVYVDFDNDGSFATAGDDITAYVTSLQASLGMEDEQAHVATVGFCQVTLNNASKRFSPEYSSGTYYGKLLPRLPFKVDVVEDGNTYTLFRGVTSRWYAQSGEFGPREAMLEAECLLSVLQSADMALPLQVDTTADALLKLVGSAAFQTARAEGYIDFAGNVSNNDTVTVGSVTYTFKTALTSPAVAGEVLIGADAESTAENLIAAINGEEGAGTTYSTGTERADVATASLDGEYLSIPMAGNAQNYAVGTVDIGGTDYQYRQAQSFTVETGGVFSQFEQSFFLNIGTPAGTMTWSLYAYDSTNEEPTGAALETDTFTPVENTWNTVTAAGTTYLTPAEYCIVLESTAVQASDNYWRLYASDGNAGDTYAGGTHLLQQVDPGPGPWGASTNQDLTMHITMTPGPRVNLAANARGAWGNSIEISINSGSLTPSDANLTGGVDGPVGLFDFSAGRQTFPFAADNWTVGNTNGLRAAEEAAIGEWGYLWCARDGTLTFKNRDWLFQRQLATAVLTFDSEPNMIDGSVSIEDVANRVTVSYTPRRVLDSAVVARAADGIRVSGKRELRRRNSSDPYKGAVITLPYVDPDGGQLVGAQNLVHPVPGTDYRVTWGEAGVGVDRSGEGFVTCTVARNAADAEVVFQNTHTRSVFVHDFQLRAEAITRYNRLQAVREDTDSIAAYGAREKEVELPLYSQQTLAESIAGYLASRYAEPAYRVPQIALRGRTTFGGVNVYSVELGDVVAVTDDQTGLDGARFVVLGYTAMLERGGYHELNWTVRRLDDVQYFILDHATYSLLNGTNRLSI